MTVTPARTRASSRPLARGRDQSGASGRGRRRARFVGAIAATILVLGSGVWAAAPATASGVVGAAGSTATPSPSPSPTASGRIDLTLSPSGNGVVTAGEGLSATVTIANGTEATLPSVRITLSLGATALPDRAALTAWLSSTGGTGGMVGVGDVDMPAIDAASSQSRTISIASTDAALANRAPGVYPMIASYTDSSGTVSSTSTMIVPDATATATGVGIVVPITAPAIGTGLLTADELTDLTAADGSLTSQLNAVDGTTAILAVDPAIPAAIRALGTAAPTRAIAWLSRLEALPNSRFALQFGDADVAAQVASTFAAPQSPVSLQAYMSAPDFVTAAGDSPTLRPTSSPTPSQTPTPASTSPSGPAYPSLDELLDIGDEHSDVYWPEGGTASAAVLSALAGSAPQSLTLVPSATLAGANPGARATADGAQVLAYDSDVSSALHAASLVDSAALRGAPLTTATAYLAFAAKDAGGRPLLVTVDRGSGRSALALGAAISAAQAPGLVPVGLDALASTTPLPAQTAETAIDQERSAAASTLAAREARVASFATILDDPSLLTGQQRAETLQLLGNAWRDTPDAWQSALAVNEAATAATLNSVGILAPTTIQLLSPQTPLQFWVHNDLPYPVNVVLHASRDDLRIDVQSQTVVNGASPRSNTRVEVPVTTHVGNAQVSIAMQLHSPTGEVIGASQRADVTVRADWEGIAITALLIIIGVLVVFGLVRTILRRRRARGAGAAPASDAPTDGAGST
ncbi:DUF6049 family protein [Microbacterium rhizomatis]|uniref:DUF6049 family protein n=1 Tax=Microbacterium rhizomatis TaxID=1631477 RepID=UPI0014782F6B|nr:DUF6049 family protein [Microbacterium rhizomatis]